LLSGWPRTPRGGSGTVHWWIAQAELLKLQKSGQFPDEPVGYPCESAVLNHFAIKAFCTLRNNNWIQLLFRKVQIQLLFRKVQNAFIAKWLSTALSQSHCGDIPTMSTTAFSNVLRLGAMCGAEKVSQLLNCPVMSLFGTRMRGTSTEMVCHRIHLKLPATTSR
jgi:hypothetical protein